MKYISTRNKDWKVSAAQAVESGIAPDGGLYVPETIPALSREEIEALVSEDYVGRAAYVMKKYLDEFSVEELTACAKAAYSRFDGDAAPLVKLDDGFYMLELWHGPTLAFKDIALTILPHLLVKSKEKLGETAETLILVATSGDTGKAALEGFRDVPGTSVMVFYPSEGVSPMQKLQMMTQEGNNVRVCGVKGNFDDCQTAVKAIFADAEVAQKLAAKNVKLSSANSINWGRLLPQIVYYVSSYCDLLGEEQIKFGDKINFCVPTGNFGDILAGWYAAKMGIPVGKLICASNTNNVLTDFFRSGEYNAKRDFYKTMSPSMDILISSNLERLLFENSGREDKLTAARMAELKEQGRYKISAEERDALKEIFAANFADEDDTIDTIGEFFQDFGYPLDPHTAVAVGVNSKYRKASEDETPVVVLSTANPYKFPQDVYYALTGDDVKDSFRACKKLFAETAMEVPESVAKLKEMPKRFSEVLARDALKAAVLDFKG